MYIKASVKSNFFLSKKKASVERGRLVDLLGSAAPNSPNEALLLTCGEK
jgi:hypothetical protein